MLVRTAGKGTSPPSGFTPPSWSSLADGWDKAPLPPSSTVKLGPETITLGHDDSERDDASKEVGNHEFGWDNENPQRKVDVGEFRIEWRPVSNGDFYEFYEAGGSEKVALPKSWHLVDDKVYVRVFLVLWVDFPLSMLTGPHHVRSCSVESRPFVARYDHLR
jgi:formylglycine-generating enzyme required for sulfatase activity